MVNMYRLIGRLPIPERIKLAWKRSHLNGLFAKKITKAREAKKTEEVNSLEAEHMFELDWLNEEEDVYITQHLLHLARRLRVPIPRYHNSNGSETGLWEKGQYTGDHYLTVEGIAALRKEIRQELKAQHEMRAHWAVWLAALTGVIGALTGLVALIKNVVK